MIEERRDKGAGKRAVEVSGLRMEKWSGGRGRRGRREKNKMRREEGLRRCEES